MQIAIYSGPLLALPSFFLICFAASAADIRIGIVGTDTSHVPQYTSIFNDPKAPNHVPGGHVVAAFKGGSPDLEISANRVEKYAEEIRTKWGVEIVPDIATLCSKVDAVLLESVDGRKHLEQVREIVKARKPMFIDKPLATTLADAREIARITKEAGVAWFSASSIRWAGIGDGLRFNDTKGVFVWGPGPELPHHQLDLSFYGIHSAELLVSILGPGCEEVTRVVGKDSDVVTCRWKDGRVGTIETLRPYGPYGVLVMRENAGNTRAPAVVRDAPLDPDQLSKMLRLALQFFEDKVPPVPNEETLEIFAFLDAAQRSKDAGGKPMKLQ
jgi:hypothetical protein